MANPMPPISTETPQELVRRGDQAFSDKKYDEAFDTYTAASVKAQHDGQGYHLPPSSFYNLGFMFENGLIGNHQVSAANDAQAFRFYALATGIAQAELRLGYMSRIGKGERKDESLAMKSYLAAAKQGVMLKPDDPDYQNFQGFVQRLAQAGTPEAVEFLKLQSPGSPLAATTAVPLSAAAPAPPPAASPTAISITVGKEDGPHVVFNYGNFTGIPTIGAKAYDGKKIIHNSPIYSGVIIGHNDQTSVRNIAGWPDADKERFAKSMLGDRKNLEEFLKKGEIPETARANPQPAPAAAAPAPAAPSPPPAAAAASTPAPPPATAASAPNSKEKMIWPVKGQVVANFGATAQGNHNDGINIAAPKDTPVVAAAGGTVAYAGNELKGYGNLVLIKHGGGLITAYAHLDSISKAVKKGEPVDQGEKIGIVGTTGGVDTPQLHFEIRMGKRALDPLKILPKVEEANAAPAAAATAEAAPASVPPRPQRQHHRSGPVKARKAQPPAQRSDEPGQSVVHDNPRLGNGTMMHGGHDNSADIAAEEHALAAAEASMNKYTGHGGQYRQQIGAPTELYDRQALTASAPQASNPELDRAQSTSMMAADNLAAQRAAANRGYYRSGNMVPVLVPVPVYPVPAYRIPAAAYLHPGHRGQGAFFHAGIHGHFRL